MPRSLHSSLAVCLAFFALVFADCEFALYLSAAAGGWLCARLIVVVVACLASLPVLPASFSAWIESTIPSLNYVQYSAQHYDATTNRVAINYGSPFSTLSIAAANGTLFELWDYAAAAQWSHSRVGAVISCTVRALNVTVGGASASAHALLPFGQTLSATQLAYAGQQANGNADT
jgi:hypothetical protein